MLPPIEVEYESLTSAARDLWGVAGQIHHIRDGWGGPTGGVSGACGDPAAGGAFEQLSSSWSIALAGLSDALDGYERNTETAAVVYQQADRASMPSTPPPPPPPPKQEAPSLFGPPPEDLVA